MGITRNAMEKLGFLPFCCAVAKINPNGFKWLRTDVKVTLDRAGSASWAANLQFR
jgi:hypothetical protein